MSVAAKLFAEKTKAKGIEGGEILAAKILEALEETIAEVSTHADASVTEKTIAVVLAPVYGGFKPQLMKLIDFDKDGQVG